MTTTLDLKASRSEAVLDGVRIQWVKNTEWRDFSKKSRVFVWADDESILDNLQNRTRRPYEAWRVLAIKVLRQLVDQNGRPLWKPEHDAEVLRLRWSQRAGCSCPCSPGFVIDSERTQLRGGDFHIHVTGVPAVDESKPPRQLV